MNTKTAYSKKVAGYKPCNEMLDAAAQSVRVNPQGSVSLPWSAGSLGVESKILVSLANRYGAMGVASKGEGAQRQFKFYYSRESTGSWFTEVWPMWKVSVWFVALLFFAVGFYQTKTGAGCFAVGVLMLLAFGPRAVAAVRNSAVAGKLSGYNYARETFPMLVAGAVLGVVMLEWAYVLPWNAGKAVEGAGSVVGLLLMPYGFGEFLRHLANAVFTTGGFAVGSVLVYQVAAVGMMRGWLESANRDGFIFAHPEAGTWFHKLMVTGSNPYAPLFMFAFFVTAVGGMALPMLK